MCSCWSTTSVKFCGCLLWPVLLLCFGWERLSKFRNSQNFQLLSTFLKRYFFLLFSRPNLPRPIRVNLIIPIVFIVLCMILVLLPSLEAPENLLIGILITAAGIPVYYLGVAWKDKPACYTRLSRGVERFCQIMFSSMFVDNEEKAV